jgi:hypothetical protein
MHTDTLSRQRTFDENNFTLTPRDSAGFKVEGIDLQHI